MTCIADSLSICFVGNNAYFTKGKTMEQLAAKRMAESLMVEHGLGNWFFEFSRTVKAAGDCSEYNRTIRLSRHFVELNTPERVRETILHEIAHALVGNAHKHDSVWRRKCLEIGGNGRQHYSLSDTAVKPPKYKGSCHCGGKFTAHRMSRRYTHGVCRKCNQGIVWEDTATRKFYYRGVEIATQRTLTLTF